jgi:hypothetical protein
MMYAAETKSPCQRHSPPQSKVPGSGNSPAITRPRATTAPEIKRPNLSQKIGRKRARTLPAPIVLAKTRPSNGGVSSSGLYAIFCAMPSVNIAQGRCPVRSARIGISRWIAVTFLFQPMIKIAEGRGHDGLGSTAPNSLPARSRTKYRSIAAKSPLHNIKVGEQLRCVEVITSPTAKGGDKPPSGAAEAIMCMCFHALRRERPARHTDRQSAACPSPGWRCTVSAIAAGGKRSAIRRGRLLPRGGRATARARERCTDIARAGGEASAASSRDR